MRVALLTRYFNNKNAGIGVYSRNLLKSLLDRKHQVGLFSTHIDSYVGYFFYTFIELALKIATYDYPDVYHALSPLEALWTPKEKTVTTFHDLIPWLHKEKETHYFSGPLSFFRIKGGSWWFKMAAKVAAKSDHIICNSSINSCR